jgi:4-amino-4-deoxy-L-arabinose transferase-like glycosyltransferase
MVFMPSIVSSSTIFFQGMESNSKWLLLLPVICVYIIGMFTDVMQPDAAQYATMSVEMLKTGNYIELFYRGEDYIDKPPLIFWVSALSFKCFGISNFSYKLPSVLFCLVGLFATYRLSKLLYNERVGFYAVLILSTTQAWFLNNQDVRTDTILATCTIFTIWQLAAFGQNKKVSHIVLASFGIAGAMLTKGPVGLMVPGLAIGTHYILRREWKLFFQWQYLLLLLLVFILLSPMLYGLYIQFDIPGNKNTYNGIIKSGLKFYFWTQSFGRLTGSSTWRNSSGPLFFTHTILWAFLPWSIIFVLAFAKKLWNVFRHRFLIKSSGEAITLGGILFPFIAFSLSQYKLPHYIFVFFPLAAIVSGKYLANIIESRKDSGSYKALHITQLIISLLILIIPLLICYTVFPLSNFWIWSVLVVGFVLVIYLAFKRAYGFGKLILPTFISAITLNFILNIHFYPSLLKYQTDGIASQEVRLSSDLPYVGFKYRSYGLDFYYQNSVPMIDDIETLLRLYKNQTVWIYTLSQGYKELQNSPIKIIDLQKVDYYQVTRLTLKFLNPNSRAEQTEPRYLMLVKIP